MAARADTSLNCGDTLGRVIEARPEAHGRFNASGSGAARRQWPGQSRSDRCGRLLRSRFSWRSARWETCKDLGQPARRGMVTGMASKKVTITLDEAQLERIRALVEAGVAPSVSGFVQHAVGVSLDDVAGWGALLAEALQETGGALSDSERAWADEVLGVTQRGGRSAA
jgi:Arc/MetJ-type ribon-helix-helix transcriptional regulator